VSIQALGIGGHQRGHHGETNVWLTPPHILHALGPFDLDPCAAPEPRPWPTAARHYVEADNGLALPWPGRVWCNPPYGEHTGLWLERLANHGDGIALIFARTETQMFFAQVWERADAVFFFDGRLTFHHQDGRRAAANGGAPSCLVAYGLRNVSALRSCGLPGFFVSLAHGLRITEQPSLFAEATP